MNLKNIKQVSKDLTLKEIKGCVDEVIELKVPELCPVISFDDFLKAEYVRTLMEQHDMEQKDAIRQLASNIRALQKN